MLDNFTTIIAAAIVAFFIGTFIGTAITKAAFDALDTVERALP